jgi:hypothetical protein
VSENDERVMAFEVWSTLTRSSTRCEGDQSRFAVEAGGEDYCEREVDEVEWQGGRVCCIWAPAGATRREVRRPLGARQEPPPGHGLEAESAAVTCSWSAAWR